MKQQGEMAREGGLKYMRNLHIIGRTRYTHTHTQNDEAKLENLEACISILEVIAHPEEVEI